MLILVWTGGLSFCLVFNNYSVLIIAISFIVFSELNTYLFTYYWTKKLFFIQPMSCYTGIPLKVFYFKSCESRFKNDYTDD